MFPNLAAVALAAVLFPASPAGAAEKSRSSAAPAPDSPCVCAGKPRCWNLVMIGYQTRVGLSKEEVEKGLPNRFFPQTLTFVMRRPTEDGHFLIVECGPRRIPCTEKREELERRLIMASFLGAVRPNFSEGTLFDPATWKISPLGEREFSAVKACRKGLSAELAEVVLADAPGI